VCQSKDCCRPHCTNANGVVSLSDLRTELHSTEQFMPASEAAVSGHKYILVVTDIFSKWVEAFPLKGTDAHTLAVVLVNEIVCRYGVPSVIHSDQGANFCSEVIQCLCNLLGIERTQTSAYHPQGNGQVERFNRTLKNMLAKVTQQNQKDWDVHLPHILFAYRTSIHESTGFSPYYINFGRSPTLPVDVMLGRVSSQDEVDQTMPQYVQQVCQSLKEAYTTARQRISITQRRRKEYKDRTATASPQLQIGDRVWLYVPAVKTGRNRKLSSLWRGPYTIIGKTSPVNYRIQLIGSTKCLVVHRNRLKLCYGEPRGRATPRSAVSEGGRPRSTPCSNAMNSDSASWVTQPQWTYADVVSGSPCRYCQCRI